MNEMVTEYVNLFRHYVRLAGIVSFVHEDLIKEYRDQGLDVKTAAHLYCVEIDKGKPRP